MVLICSHGAVHGCLSQKWGAVKSWGRDPQVLCSRCTSVTSPGSFLRGAQGHLPNMAVPRANKVSLPRGKSLSVVVIFTILDTIIRMCSPSSQIGNLIPSATTLEGRTFKKCWSHDVSALISGLSLLHEWVHHQETGIAAKVSLTHSLPHVCACSLYLSPCDNFHHVVTQQEGAYPMCPLNLGPVSPEQWPEWTLIVSKLSTLS